MDRTYPDSKISPVVIHYKDNKPTGDYQNSDCKALEYGLTKREYFAAMAMQGVLASNAGNESVQSTMAVAGYAVAYADALIKVLNIHIPQSTDNG